jgi:hypothetical protein
MMNLAEIILDQIRPVIESWTEPDIYAISFFVYDEDDDERRPTLTVGYNTESFFRNSIKMSDDADETRWNFAFWPQNKEYQFGYDESADIIQNWICENGYDIVEDNDESEYNENGRYIGKGPLITQMFVEQLILVSKRLHDEGIIMRKFRKPIPIIIHELEYYDAISDNTQAANPVGIADDFCNWVMKM